MTVQQCADACKAKAGCEFFILGYGEKEGSCYHEFTATEECTEGWDVDEYNFYKVGHAQFDLVKEDHECNSDDQYIGEFTHAQGCADKCKDTFNCEFFLFGKNDKAGNCYHEKTATEECTEGW